MDLAYTALGFPLKKLFTHLSRRRLPQVSGRVYLSALQTPVRVIRDQWGIPHIQAADRSDLFFAQGFVHAQDRMWQMELNRRAANGQLSALFGSLTLDIDRLVRTLGFARLALHSLAALSTRAYQDLVAYASGVNAYLAGAENLPIEFSLMRHRPEKWRPVDSLAYSRLQMWALTHGAMGELVQAQLNESLGPEMGRQLGLQYPDQNPVTLADGIELNKLVVDRMMGSVHRTFLGKGGVDGTGRGSNCWVISAERSTTGHAILSNDMHLPIGTPSLWYYLHLHSADGFHVAGFSQPGLPYVLVGHNGHLAWGATLSYADCEDLYVEKLNPENPAQYQFRGEWRASQIIDEEITVRGKSNHREQVILTHHGPIISQVIPGESQVLALSSMALRSEAAFDGFGRLNEAVDWDEFVEAVSRIETPSLNLLYADVHDNIGHYVSGRIPIRNKGDGLLPVPGWSGDFEWVGEIPFDEMPHALNPRQGFLVSANNRIVGDEYPHFLGHVWRNGYRARRIEQLINGQANVSLEDCQRFQFDVHSLAGLELVGRLVHFEPGSADASLSWQLLRDWDGQMGIDSVGATIYQVLLGRLAENILAPHLDRESLMRLLGTGLHPMLAPVNEFQGYWPVILGRLLGMKAQKWWADRDDLIERSLVEVTAELRHRLGDDWRQWQWGRLHQVRFHHVLGMQPPLDRVFNQGPFPIGGDNDTVAQTSIRPDLPYENNAISIASRHVIDLGEWDNCWAMYTPGQSGQLGSPHYGDMIQPWLQGTFFRMAWSAEAVAAVSRHELVLTPMLQDDKGSHNA